MKAKKRGKRPGLRARSKNARAKKTRVQKLDKRDKYLREHFEAYIAKNPQLMYFRDATQLAPNEGNLVLVRLLDNTFRFGLVLKGKFANYEYHVGEFVTMANQERITHWMQIVPPVVIRHAAEVAADPITEREAEFQAGGEVPEGQAA